jgi:predicted O-methyltransferase YrrM
MGGGNEFPARIKNKAGVWFDRFSPAFGIGDVQGEGEMGRALAGLLANYPIQVDSSVIRGLEEQIASVSSSLSPTTMPFGSFHNGSSTLGRLCYEACRRIRARVVVETGVAYGVTSAYVLQALTENDTGVLHSIDLPPLAPNAVSYIGHFVPSHLRARWTLHVGSARRLLLPVLNACPPDVFIHDSLHTHAHMKWEFEVALRALRPGGIIIADDIEGNRAFEEAAKHSSIDAWFAIEQKGKASICGVMRKKLG